MLFSILLFALGLALLIKGAGWLVDGASALAKRYQISDLTIGLTIVAFGTSAPELVVNTVASLQDYQNIVFGNVIGSNNFNLFAILGITGLITPLVVSSSTVWKEIPISFGATAVLFLLTNDFFASASPILTRIDGAILLGLFGLFMFYIYRQVLTDTAVPEITQHQYSSLKIWGLISIGLVSLVIGGRLIVTNAVKIATSLELSEKVIGVTIVAAGTSLPELATSVMAAIKKNNNIAIGNIIGSNIFNILFILAISALLRPIPFDRIFNFDLYLLAGGTVFLFLAMFMKQRKQLDRWEAAFLLAVYVGYTIYLIG